MITRKIFKIRNDWIFPLYNIKNCQCSCDKTKRNSNWPYINESTMSWWSRSKTQHYEVRTERISAEYYTRLHYLVAIIKLPNITFLDIVGTIILKKMNLKKRVRAHTYVHSVDRPIDRSAIRRQRSREKNVLKLQLKLWS